MSTADRHLGSLSRVFIEWPRLAAVVAIVMAVAGIIALPHLAMEEFPEIAPPQIYVSTSYAGTDTVQARKPAKPKVKLSELRRRKR